MCINWREIEKNTTNFSYYIHLYSFYLYKIYVALLLLCKQWLKKKERKKLIKNEVVLEKNVRNWRSSEKRRQRFWILMGVVKRAPK